MTAMSRCLTCWLPACLIARSLCLAHQPLGNRASCFEPPVTLRWTGELRAGHTLIEGIHHLLAIAAETQGIQAEGEAENAIL
jgi:hypothetical protein